MLERARRAWSWLKQGRGANALAIAAGVVLGVTGFLAYSYGAERVGRAVHASMSGGWLAARVDESSYSTSTFSWESPEVEFYAGVAPATLHVCSEASLPPLKTEVYDVYLRSTGASRYQVMQFKRGTFMFDADLRVPGRGDDTPRLVLEWQTAPLPKWTTEDLENTPKVEAELRGEVQADFQSSDLETSFLQVGEKCGSVVVAPEAHLGTDNQFVVEHGASGLQAYVQTLETFDARAPVSQIHYYEGSGQVTIGASPARDLGLVEVNLVGAFSLRMHEGLITLSGRSTSAELNGEEILPRRWAITAEMPDKVVIAAISAIVGGLIAQLLNATFHRKKS